MKSYFSGIVNRHRRPPRRQAQASPLRRQAPPARGQEQAIALMESDAEDAAMDAFVRVIQVADPQARRGQATQSSQANQAAATGAGNGSGPGGRRPFGYDARGESPNDLSPPASLLIENAWPEAAHPSILVSGPGQNPGDRNSDSYASTDIVPGSPGPYRPRQYDFLRNLTPATAAERVTDRGTQTVEEVADGDIQASEEVDDGDSQASDEITVTDMEAAERVADCDNQHCPYRRHARRIQAWLDTLSLLSDYMPPSPMSSAFNLAVEDWLDTLSVASTPRSEVLSGDDSTYRSPGYYAAPARVPGTPETPVRGAENVEGPRRGIWYEASDGPSAAVDGSDRGSGIWQGPERSPVRGHRVHTGPVSLWEALTWTTAWRRAPAAQPAPRGASPVSERSAGEGPSFSHHFASSASEQSAGEGPSSYPRFPSHISEQSAGEGPSTYRRFPSHISEQSAGEGPSRPPVALTPAALQDFLDNTDLRSESSGGFPELDTSSLSFSVGDSNDFTVTVPAPPGPPADPPSSPMSSYHSGSSSEISGPDKILRDLREEDGDHGHDEDDTQ